MIKLRKEERRPIGILMMMFFCIVGSSITGASARDTFFLTQFDKSLLPLMFSLVAGLMVVVIYIYNKIASTLDLIQVIRSSSIFFCTLSFTFGGLLRASPAFLHALKNSMQIIDSTIGTVKNLDIKLN